MSFLARSAQVIVAVAAVAGAVGGYAWILLPDVRALRNETPSSTAFMRLRAEQARDAGRATHVSWRWTSHRRIAQSLKTAVIVSEDAAFWSHDGIDVHELRMSIEDSLRRGGAPRGASTITQQLAKNLYLSPSRNPFRKLVELMISRRLEAELSKSRIFELYLNVIEWGDGVWGAEAAARTYFGKSAAELTDDEAALLAAAIINPRIHSPARPDARLRSRQRIILERLARQRDAAGPVNER
jgi:monofunctional biosynthetic peptidoglycan transglycosylase